MRSDYMNQDKKKSVSVLHMRCGIFTGEVEHMLKEAEILYDEVIYDKHVWIRVKIDMFAGSNEHYVITQDNTLGEKGIEINKSLVYMFALFDVKVRNTHE